MIKSNSIYIFFKINIYSYYKMNLCSNLLLQIFIENKETETRNQVTLKKFLKMKNMNLLLMILIHLPKKIIPKKTTYMSKKIIPTLTELVFLNRMMKKEKNPIFMKIMIKILKLNIQPKNTKST